MAMENVEDPFKNRLSFGFHMKGDWAMNGDFWVKEHISGVSKTFSPSSLNIIIHDLMEEATPSISSVKMTDPAHYATASKMRSNCHVFFGVKRNKRNHQKIFKQKFFS